MTTAIHLSGRWRQLPTNSGWGVSIPAVARAAPRDLALVTARSGETTLVQLEREIINLSSPGRHTRELPTPHVLWQVRAIVKVHLASDDPLAIRQLVSQVVRVPVEALRLVHETVPQEQHAIARINQTTAIDTVAFEAWYEWYVMTRASEAYDHETAGVQRLLCGQSAPMPRDAYTCARTGMPGLPWAIPGLHKCEPAVTDFSWDVECSLETRQGPVESLRAVAVAEDFYPALWCGVLADTAEYPSRHGYTYAALLATPRRKRALEITNTSAWWLVRRPDNTHWVAIANIRAMRYVSDHLCHVRLTPPRILPRWVSASLTGLRRRQRAVDPWSWLVPALQQGWALPAILPVSDTMFGFMCPRRPCVRCRHPQRILYQFCEACGHPVSPRRVVLPG